ncbi:MAG: DUF1289 domain-containing protein [Fimbriimonadaceae bacterium]|nr:DUF1289 domain-containing protein [Fimbriimonadaceae bacterium]
MENRKVSEIDQDVASPCVHLCRLDGQSICTGCGRSVTEITSWPMMTPDQKWNVVQAARARLARRRAHTG